MHPNSTSLMEYFRKEYSTKDMKVIDVGSADVNGSFRPLFSDYTGLDIAPGKGVDIVAPGLYDFGIEDNAYEVAISGSTLEHVQDMKAWMHEVARITSKYICVIAPYEGFAEHRHPVDCWRILPDGLRWLMEDAGLKVRECRISGVKQRYNDGSKRWVSDVIGIAEKV